MKRFSVLLSLLVGGLIPSVAGGEQQAIATIDLNVKGLELSVMSVERKNSILTVKWAVRNTSESRQSYKANFAGRQITTYVLDEENGVKYYVLADQEGNSVASQHVYTGSDSYGISESLEPKQTYRYWMKLPAPPAEVESVSLFFTDAQPVEGVAITEK